MQKAMSSCEVTGVGGQESGVRNQVSRIMRFLPLFRWEGVEAETYKAPADHWCGITRQVLVGNRGESLDFQLRYFEIAPGGFSSLESHAHEHAVVVMRGQGKVRLGETEQSLSFGDVVYVISDGEDTTSHLLDSQAEMAVARTGVRVCVVRLQRAGMPALALSPADHWIRTIAEATGGYVSSSEARTRRTDAIKSLRSKYSLITRVYRIEVAFPHVVDQPRKWNLEVSDSNGQRLKRVRLIYPRLLVPTSDK